MTDSLPALADRAGNDPLAGLAHVLARAQAEGRAVTVVYAPTTITHTHHASPAPVSVGSMAPAGAGMGPGHPGIDIDATGYGYVPAGTVASLPAVPESRTLAPLAFLLSAWSFVGAACAAALTDGNPGAVGALVAAFAASGASGVALYRRQQP